MWRVSSILRHAGLSSVPYGASESVRERGLSVHRANEALAFGYEPVVERPVYQQYVDGLARWYREFRPSVVSVERRVINRDMSLTGRIDLIAVVNGIPYVIDVKTGGKAAWHAVQTAGYQSLARADLDVVSSICDIPDVDPDVPFEIRRGVIYLPGNGACQWSVFDDAYDEYVFGSALELTRWRYRHGFLTETDPERPDDDMRMKEDVVTP